jgi:hypothetical protein
MAIHSGNIRKNILAGLILLTLVLVVGAGIGLVRPDARQVTSLGLQADGEVL